MIKPIIYGWQAVCPICSATKEVENADGTVPMIDAISAVRRAKWLSTFDGYTWTCTCPKCRGEK